MKDVVPEKRLGRGLSALIGENRTKADQALLASAANQKGVELVPLSKIIAGVYQPRKNFDDAQINELADSIKEKGVIQPIILRRIAENDTYEIIAGERRFRASTLAGLTEIPALVKKLNNHEALELALIENIQRADLSLIEEANGYKRLIEDFSYSQEQIAQKVGKSRSHIANLLRLLALPPKVQELLENGSISMGHARAIINSQNPEILAQQIISRSLTVRDIEDLVRDEKVQKSQTTPAFVRTESKVRFISSQHLHEISEKLTSLMEMQVKVSYNANKNNGKLSIKFDDFAKIQQLVEKLERN